MGLSHSVLSEAQFIMGIADGKLSIPSLILEWIFYISVTIMPGCDLLWDDMINLRTYQIYNLKNLLLECSNC